MNLSDAFDDLLSPLPPVAPLSQEVVVRGRRRRRAKLAALGGGGAAAVAGVLALVLSSGSTPAPDRVVTGATPTAEPTSEATPLPVATAVQLVLEPGGLGYLRGPSSIGRVTFEETSAAEVQRLVQISSGPGVATALPDCGASIVQVAYRGGFTLTLDGDRWVGWSSAEEPTYQRFMSTADGIGLGSTLADLRASFAGVQVTTGTVGVEWSTAGDDGLAGSLSGTAPTSTVTRIASGNTCVFR